MLWPWPRMYHVRGLVPSSSLNRTASFSLRKSDSFTVLPRPLTATSVTRSPIYSTPIGQPDTQAGSSPWGSRSAHVTHLPTVPLTCGTGNSGLVGIGRRWVILGGSVQLKYRASYGQAAMQARQPMHTFWSTSTRPSALRKVAPTGQTYVQGGSSHIMQSLGMWKVPPSAPVIA